MARFGWFVFGSLSAFAYGVAAGTTGARLADLDPSGGLICFLIALAVWVIVAVFAYRRGPLWFAHGWLAAPAVAVLLFTVSCFALIAMGAPESAVAAIT